MGFPSPAADYVESRLSLDEALIQKPAATYYMRAGETIYRCGIMKDALLVIDSSLKPCDGSLLICDCNGEFKVKRYRTYPQRILRMWRMGERRGYLVTMKALAGRYQYLESSRTSSTMRGQVSLMIAR